jgi:hypothetical protein
MWLIVKTHTGKQGKRMELRVETAQHSTENQKRALSHFRTKAEIENSSSAAAKCQREVYHEDRSAPNTR